MAHLESSFPSATTSNDIQEVAKEPTNITVAPKAPNKTPRADLGRVQA